MAAPIVHIYLSLQILAGPLAHHDQAEFLRGTSFPDIRYVAPIEREKTHIPEVTWQQIVEEPSAFRAGMLFHSFLDEARHEFLVAHDGFRGLPDSPLRDHALKFYEDTIICGRCSNLAEIAQCFDTLSDESLQLGVSQEQLVKWYTYLKFYCVHKEPFKLLSAFSGSLKHASLDNVKELAILTDAMKHHGKHITCLINEFCDTFQNNYCSEE